MIFSKGKMGSEPQDGQDRPAGFLSRGQRRAPGANPEPRGGRLPRFAVAATDDLADIVLGAGERRPDRVRLALADALAASQPVTSAERFAGRADVLEALIRAVEQSRSHVVLYGERGIGKTSLLHVFAETAREARYIVLYGSCGVEARFSEMFATFAAGIPLLYHAEVSPTADESEHDRTFADLLGPEPTGPRDLADLFRKIVGTRVLLILDEYDRVRDPAFRRDVAELIKNLSDRAARVQLVLAGVASNLDELVGFTPSIRRNLVALAVGPMADAEMAEILDRAEEASGLGFSPDARALVLKMAAGSPYLVRLVAARAAVLALDGGRMTATAADVQTGAEAVLAEWSAGLSASVQRLLALPEVRSEWPLLIAAARASGTPEGWFIAEDLAPDLAGCDPAAIKARLEGFVAKLPLFETDNGPDGDAGGRIMRFRFRTQGLAQLLILSAALARATS
jgi:hypothetical protein